MSEPQKKTSPLISSEVTPTGMVLFSGEWMKTKSVEKLVPGEGEREDPGGEDTGYGKRQDDVDHRLNAGRAVDARAFLQLLRDGREVAHQQPGAERHQEGRIGEDQRPGGVLSAPSRRRRR